MTGVTLHGAERTYRLDCSTTDALVRLEEETGLTLDELVPAVQRADVDRALLIDFLRAVLVEPASDADLEVILDDIGGPPVIAAAAEGLG